MMNPGWNERPIATESGVSAETGSDGRPARPRSAVYAELGSRQTKGVKAVP